MDLRFDIGKYQQSLVNVAYRITNDIECARDIVQDTYVTVLQTNGTFNGFSSLKTYLYRIVINKCIDARRRQARWLRLSDTISKELPWGQRNTEEDFDGSYFVRGLLKNIPDKFRIPLVLAEVDEMSYEEIAETLQISLNTVRTRIYRCREKLRKELVKTGRLP